MNCRTVHLQSDIHRADRPTKGKRMNIGCVNQVYLMTNPLEGLTVMQTTIWRMQNLGKACRKYEQINSVTEVWYTENWSQGAERCNQATVSVQNIKQISNFEKK